jgi:tetratricopeptide (TPR) repeat protein
VLPPDHPHTLYTMSNLAASYAALERHTDALKIREETLAAMKRTLPPDHPDTLGSMHNLANSYDALNRRADALKIREQMLATRKRVLPSGHPDTLLSMWAVAESLVAVARGAEAIPYIDECVANSAGKAVHPSMIPGVMTLRVQHFRKSGDPAGCRATALMWENLNRTDAESLYDAARFRAVAAAVQAKDPAADAARLAKEDADRAMAWLTKAVAAGYTDRAQLEMDPDLDCLRERDDFKKLLEALPAAGK